MIKFVKILSLKKKKVLFSCATGPPLMSVLIVLHKYVAKQGKGILPNGQHQDSS